MMFPKENAWRNKKYTNWVKQQLSIVSGLPADDPHHIIGHGFSGSVKAPDWATTPLTRDEHNHLHHIGYSVWEEIHGSQLDLLMRFWQHNFDDIRGFM